jgi:class 3 adenylate cyclase
MTTSLTGEAQNLFALLRRQSVDSETVDAIERAVAEAPDRELCRINALDFAARRRLAEEPVIAAFLHASRLGLFELSWNVLCPGCGGVLDTNATLKTISRSEYPCAWCAASYEPNLDDIVEVTFTVSRRVRRIAAHEPDELPFFDYMRQVFWSSAIDLPDDLERVGQDVTLDTLELPAGEKAQLSLQLPAGSLILFEPVGHTALFIEVGGEATRARQNFGFVFNDTQAPPGTTALRPGPLRLSLENRTARRLLPSIWISCAEAHELLARRRPFLTAKRLLTNQTFRDIYRTDTIDPDQRLKITSLTFLFTDLQGSTELYERVGDLAAFDIVRRHFRLLEEIVATEAGAVVKTNGDAVMATFPTPDRAMAAALRMREAMRALNAEHDGEDLLLKIGIHEGPCLAVVLNDRQDYFGQTVNIASRVQGLAGSRAIYATGTVVRHPKTTDLLAASGLLPVARQRQLRGIPQEFAVYEIP